MGFLDQFLSFLGLTPGPRTGPAPAPPRRPDPAPPRRGDLGPQHLSSPDRQTKIEAARALRERRDPSALPALVAALDDGDPAVRREVVLAIYGFGREALPALPAILKSCADPDPEVRGWGLSALAPGGLNPPTEEVFPLLLARLGDDPSPRVRREAVSILSSHLSASKVPFSQLAAPAMIAALRDPDLEVRRQVAFNIGWSAHAFRAHPPLIPGLCEALAAALADPDPMVHYRAATGLPNLDPSDLRPLPALLGLVERASDLFQAREAAVAAAKLEGPAAREKLLALARGPDPSARLRGHFALLQREDEREAALDALVQVMLHDPARRAVALECCTLVHLPASIAARACPALLQILRGPDASLRKPALRGLRTAGVNDAGAIQAVIALLSHPEKSLRQEAMETLGNICKDASIGVPLMRSALRDPEESVRNEAARVLAWFGKSSVEALPDLIELLKRSKGRVAYELFYALGSLRELAREAAPLLIGLLDSPDGTNRDRAAEALASVGLAGALAAPDLAARVARALTGGSAETRRSLLRAAREAGVASRPLAPALGEVLLKGEEPLRAAAFDALGALGPGVTAAVASAVATALPSLDEPRALRALGLLAGASPPGLDELLATQLRARPPAFARQALAPLAALGAPALLALLEGTQSRDERVCVEATRLLLALAPAHLDALEAALLHHDPSLRLRAVGALAQLGPDARPALERALAHPDEMIRDQAAIALG